VTEPFGHGFLARPCTPRTNRSVNDHSKRTQYEENTMLTKAILGLAVILATASGALAVTKSHSVAPNAYGAYSRDAAYIGTDPDLNIRFELNRDRTHRVGQ
jgi:hypothetical protein